MLKKKEVQQTIEQMPDEFLVDELLVKLRFISKINRGLEEVKSSKLQTHDEAKETICSWFN